MLRVALTGNIASGKSTVVERWRALGAAVIDADLLARRAVEPGTPGLAAVAAAFGPAVLDAAGRLDRAALRRIVFSDPTARATLEGIVHPEVARLRDQDEARLREAGTALVVHDIPLLFEVGAERSFDLVVLVDAPPAERVARIVRHRGLAEAEARAMVAAQMPASRKRARADIVIDNDGTIEELDRKAEAAWREVRERLAASG